MWPGLLRKCLQEGDGGTDAFARKIYGGYDISLERFNELTQERLENTGRVAGVFELDFDKKVFSAVHILDGWKSYRFQDVSAAAYQAFRKEHSSQEERWRKFVSRLEGKELTDRDLGVPLKALRDLQPGDLLFTEPANRMGRLLDFQVDCSSDMVQMEVFSPEVKCAKTGSWLDIYVSYDVARQEVRDHLDLTLHRKDGAWKKSFTYVLSPSERELLRTELEEHCQKQYRKTLNDLYAERYRQEAGTPAQAGWREPAVGSAAGLLRRRHLRVRRNAVLLHAGHLRPGRSVWDQCDLRFQWRLAQRLRQL